MAIGRCELASGTNGGNSASGGYIQRKFATWEGETWFVSGFDGTMGPGGTTDQFDLDPGTYKVSGTSTAYKSNGAYTLMDSTDNQIQIWGTNARGGNTTEAQLNCPFEGTFTITEKKTFKIWTFTVTTLSTYGLGVENGTSTGVPAARVENYGNVIIEKLK